MARGGYRPGGGRPKGVKNGDAEEDVVENAEMHQMTPLEYMLMVMNDVSADESRRDRMAQAAAPYCHGKMADQGKKEKKDDAAKKAGAGKFQPGEAPRLVHSR